MIPSQGCLCIEVLHLGLPYAIRLPYQRKPLVTTVSSVKLPLHIQDEESTSEGITMVTSQQSIQEYFFTKSGHHTRRRECSDSLLQEEHCLAGSGSSNCDQHLKEKTRTKRKRRNGELKERRRQPSETGSVRRSELKSLEGR